MSNDKGEDAFFDQFCQNVRRFTDYHISSMLHSLIGLPSMVTPPSGQTWVIIDEEMRPKKERAYSDGDGRLEGKTMEEIQKLKATWIAERDGNGRGNLENVGGDKTKAESEGSSSSASSSSSSSFPAGPGSDRAIYVFRFPSSYPRYGFSDSPYPDAYQQVEKLSSHMRHSFFDDDFFPLGIQSFFGLLHPFMFSSFAGLPRLHDYRHHPPLEEGMEDFDSWRRMRDDEIRWARKVYGYLCDDSRTSFGERTQGNSGEQKEEPQKSLLPPPPSSHSWDNKQERESQPEPSTELDIYEHLDSVNSNSSKEESSLATRKPGAPRVISTSSSTESRTLPDGSSFTKTIKITRYEDGTEQRIEDVHSTPPREDNFPTPRDGYIGDSSTGTLSSASSQEDRVTAHDLDRMGGRMHEYLMRSPFFEDVKRSRHSFRRGNFLDDERPHQSEQATRISETPGTDSMSQQTRTADKDEKNGGK